MDGKNESSPINQTLTSDSGLSVVSIVVIVVDIFLIIIICGGNLLTLLSVWLTPALRTVPNMYVVSLAVADLLAGLVVPYQMIIFFPGMQEALNSDVYACLFRYSLFFVSGSESILCLVAISLDRWLYIAKPLRYAAIVTPVRAGLVIALTWCLAFVYGSVPFYDNKWTETTACRLFDVLTHRYQIYGQVTSYAIGTSVCIVAYCNIFKIAYKQRRSIKDISSVGNNKDLLKKAKNDWHLIKLFVLVFGVFFLCWTPTFVCVSLGHTVGVPDIAMDIAGPLSVLNSGMNFFIYAYKNKEFRQAFARILCVSQRCSSPRERIEECSSGTGRNNTNKVPSRGHTITSTVPPCREVETDFGDLHTSSCNRHGLPADTSSDCGHKMMTYHNTSVL